MVRSTSFETLKLRFSLLKVFLDFCSDLKAVIAVNITIEWSSWSVWIFILTMNSFNQGNLQQFQSANCSNAYCVTSSGGSLYANSTAAPQTASNTSTLTNTSLGTMQQSTAANFVANFQPNYSQTSQTVLTCLQKEIESLKKSNSDLQAEMEKTRSSFEYQIMSANIKLNEQQKQLEELYQEKVEQEKAHKELKVKYDEKYSLFRSPHQSDERSFFCDECIFETTSQVALFIHKLNHHFESSIPRHLQLSTRSFSTMPDDSIRFKYKCHCCEIDSQREFARHEIFSHIYQFHTFESPFKCKYCFLYFTSKSYLNDHLVEKHSTPSRVGKGKRKANGLPANGAHLKSGCLSAGQLNSTLPLKLRTSPLEGHCASSTKPSKKLNSLLSEEPADINDLFQQLVGETIISSGQQVNLESSATTKETTSNQSTTHRSNSTVSSAVAATPTAPESLQRIMSDLDGDDKLNCSYPGCNFIASSKNHLKFHISAHLMSKVRFCALTLANHVSFVITLFRFV